MPSEKILEAKKKIVADLVANYKEAQSFVFVDARGLTVEQDTALNQGRNHRGQSCNCCRGRGSRSCSVQGCTAQPDRLCIALPYYKARYAHQSCCRKARV